MYKIINFHLGPFGTNCYLVKNDSNCVLIDCGGNGKGVAGYLQDNQLTLNAILLTHGHADHIWGLEELQKETDCKVYIHRSDVICFKDPQKNVSDVISEPYTADIKNIIAIDDNSIIKESDLEFKVIHTPGHTEGSVCFELNEEVLFSGDTLFCGSRGRTDYIGGSDEKMLESLKKLKNLDGDRQVLPGHGEFTTLDNERKSNYNMRFI